MTLTKEQNKIEGILKKVQQNMITQKEANLMILKIRELKKSLSNKG